MIKWNKFIEIPVKQGGINLNGRLIKCPVINKAMKNSNLWKEGNNLQRKLQFGCVELPIKCFPQIFNPIGYQIIFSYTQLTHLMRFNHVNMEKKNMNPSILLMNSSINL
jgi:hypothetical protein